MARTKNKPYSPEPIQLPPEEKPSHAENIISVVLGLAVVLVIGSMIINAIKGRNNIQQETKAPETTQEQVAQNTHTVAEGETLWSIAEKYYNDGFKWVMIQKANNLTTDSVEVGTKLVIPEKDSAQVAQAETQKTETPAENPTPTSAVVTIVVTKAPELAEVGSTGPSGNTEATGQTLSASTDKQYTVKEGDTLWAIAVAKYNDGYRWVDIAKANSLVNPDVIHPGNTFILP